MRRFHAMPLAVLLILQALALPPARAQWLSDPGGSPWQGRVRLTPTGAGPLVTDVSALAARAYALTDDRGRRVTFSVTGDETDPTLRELSFTAAPGRSYLLYYSAEDGPRQWPDEPLAVEDLQAGSWEPAWLPPVNARGSEVPLSAARQQNAPAAARVAEGLRTEGPMLVVQTGAWEVWIGGHSGLIERLRPTGHAWAGSALREWAANLPNTPASGRTVVTERNAAWVRLRHYGEVLRDLEIWADGTLLTVGEASWHEPALVVAARPFEHLQPGAQAPTASFADLVGPGVLSAATSVLGWEAPAGPALSCQMTGGDFGPVDALAQGDDAVALLAGAGEPAGLGGLCRTVVPAAWWHASPAALSAGGDVRLDYFPRSLRSTPGGRFGVQQARMGLLEGPPAGQVPPAAEEPPASPAIEVSPATATGTCLLPGRGLSPQLEAYALATPNPPPVWFDLTIAAPTDTEQVRVVVDAAPWLEAVEAGPAGEPPAPVQRAADRYEVAVPVQDGGARVRIGLLPAEGALGTLVTTVRALAPGLAALTALRAHIGPGIPLFALGTGGASAPGVVPLRIAQVDEWVSLPGTSALAPAPRMALVSQPDDLAGEPVITADLPLLAAVDEASACALAAAWQAFRESHGNLSAGSEQMLAATLLRADGPLGDYGELRRLAWLSWSLGLTDGGVGWRADLPLAWATDEGLLPTDRLLAIADTAEDLRLLGRARARGQATGPAAERALAGEFSAARALLSEPAPAAK